MNQYTLHGTTIDDPYCWLENLDSPETREWVATQNRTTEAFLANIPQRAAIRKRLTELWNYEKCGVPVQRGGRSFFMRNDGLQNQSVLCVSGLRAETMILLDPNELSPDGTIALTGFVPSPDGRLLACGLAGAGSDWEEWRVLSVDSGEASADHLKWVKFSSVSWTADSKGFFYNRYDEPGEDTRFHGTNYFQKVFFHRIGTAQSEDELAYFRPDQKEWVYSAVVSDDGRYLVIHVWNATSDHNGIFYRDLSGDGPIIELISSFDARYTFIDNDGATFWIQTDVGAPRGRVLAVDLSNAGRESWREVIPEKSYTLETVSVVGHWFAVRYLRDAQSLVEIRDLAGELVRTVDLPGIGTVTGFAGGRGDSETFFDFTSYTTPTRVYRYDLATGRATLFHQPKASFDPADFVTRQVFYPSKDGTAVPMFISHRRGLQLDGNNPVELYGYGGFNIALTPVYSPSRLAWMEMGGVYAVANLRGGGEYGEEWHEAGTKSKKQNVFDDFIAAAEWLVAAGYTSTAKLAISGRSNGGLLVGACITQRPELFGAAVAGVGVMDMLRFHQFTIGWTWVSDYGSPDDAEEFRSLLAYSPYHNIRGGVSYPPTMVTTADHDDRVVPAHSYKFSAALQAAQAGPAPILARIDVRAGHGMGKPTSKLIDEATDILSFFTKTLSVSRAASVH